MNHNRLLMVLLFFSALLQGHNTEVEKPASRPNVLFICVDDLRPELGCYGARQIQSPHIDKLASEGLLFNRAYCNVPVCGASRASLLTGILPTKTRFVNYKTYVSKDTPEAKTLPQVFKENGYSTYSVGKVFHHRDDCESQSWTEPNWMGGSEKLNFQLALDPTTRDSLSERGRGRVYESPDVADIAYPDGKIALQTIEYLQKLSATNEPFFLACGFIRPHLPFYAPKKYWDLYPRDSISLADNRYLPEHAPEALHGSGEFNSYHLAGLAPKSDEFHQVMKHGYLASVSYVDKLIGDVLAAVENLGLAENTIIVLWGDHGWHLGEHDFWGKHNTMHLAMKVPLIIKVPNGAKGKQSNALIETTDIFPTLCDLTGLTQPDQLHGKSFVKVLDNPEKSFRKYAYSRFVRGDAIITDRYSYTHYSGEKEEIMLYDLKNDPDENENIAMDPINKSIVEEMQHLLLDAESRAKAIK